MVAPLTSLLPRLRFRPESGVGSLLYDAALVGFAVSSAWATRSTTGATARDRFTGVEANCRVTGGMTRHTP